jgi:hypothetical protein
MADPAFEYRLISVHVREMVPAIGVFLIGEIARDQEVGNVLL